MHRFAGWGNMINSKTFDTVSHEAVQSMHDWIIHPLHLAFAQVEKTAFFQWIPGVKSPAEFAPVATQIYHHSATFPKAIGLMLSQMPLSEGKHFRLVAEHAFEEADHHLMLLE